MTNAMTRDTRSTFQIGLLYAAVAVLPALSLLLNPFGPPLYYPRGDIATTFWNMWWFDQAVMSGRNPLQSPMIFHPFGAYLYLHTFELPDAFLTAPVRALFGYPDGLFLAWKIAFVGHTFWTAVAMHMLARRLGATRGAAVVVSVIAATSTFRHVSAGAISVQATGSALFLLWAAVGCWQQPSAWRRGLWLGGAATLLLVSSLSYLFFCSMILTVVGAALLVFGLPTRERLLGHARQLAAAAVVGALPLVFIASGIHTAGQHLGTTGGFSTAIQVKGSAEALQFLLPAWALQLVYAQGVSIDEVLRGAAPLRSFSFAPPISLVVLGLIAAIMARGGGGQPGESARDDVGQTMTRRGLVVAVVFSLFIALGPAIKLWTTFEPADAPFITGPTKPMLWEGLSVPSPYALVADWPVFRHIRGNLRAGFFTLVAVMLLMAPIIERTLALLRRWPAFQGRYAIAALVALTLLEQHRDFLPAEKPPAGITASMRELGHMPGPGGVREYPPFGYVVQGMAMYHQTIHGRPLLGGYLSRDPAGYDRWLESRAWEMALRRTRDEAATPLSSEERQQVLTQAREDGLRFVINNRDLFISDGADRADDLPRVILGNKLGHRIHADETMEIFELAPP